MKVILLKKGTMERMLKELDYYKDASGRMTIKESVLKPLVCDVLRIMNDYDEALVLKRDCVISALIENGCLTYIGNACNENYYLMEDWR